jgi:hypothetical protein
MTVISLPALLFFHSQYQLHEHKEQMEKKLLQVQSVEIVVPATSVEWEFWGKEIRINGKLFDLLSIEFKNGQAICKGIFDEEEEILEARLEHYLNHTAKGSKSRSLCKQWIAITLHCKTIPSILPAINLNWLKTKYPSHTSLLYVFSKELLSPPPEC